MQAFYERGETGTLCAFTGEGKRAVTAKGIFEELQNTRCMVFDAPGISPEYWDELVKRWGIEKVEGMTQGIFSIFMRIKTLFMESDIQRKTDNFAVKKFEEIFIPQSWKF